MAGGTSEEKDDIYKCVLCDRKKIPPTAKMVLSRFPLDPVICRTWVQMVGINELASVTIEELNETKFLCQAHFKSGCYTTSGGSIFLKPAAIPTEQLFFPPLSLNVLLDFPNKEAEDGNLIQINDDDSFQTEYLEDFTNNAESIETQSANPYRTGNLFFDSERLRSNPNPITRTNLKFASESTKPKPGLSMPKPGHPMPRNLPFDSESAQTKPANTPNTLAFDEIDTLFLSYAGMFKKLTTKLQTMVKLDMAKLFARYEMKNAAFLEKKQLEQKENETKVFFRPKEKGTKMQLLKTALPVPKISTTMSESSSNSASQKTYTRVKLLKRLTPLKRVVSKTTQGLPDKSERMNPLPPKMPKIDINIPNASSSTPTVSQDTDMCKISLENGTVLEGFVLDSSNIIEDGIEIPQNETAS